MRGIFSGLRRVLSHGIYSSSLFVTFARFLPITSVHPHLSQTYSLISPFLHMGQFSRLVIYLQLLLFQAELVAPCFDAVSEYLNLCDVGFFVGLVFDA